MSDDAISYLHIVHVLANLLSVLVLNEDAFPLKRGKVSLPLRLARALERAGRFAAEVCAGGVEHGRLGG